MAQANAGEMVKAARARKGWTQQDLAHHADLTYKTISTVENGGTVRPKTLRKIAEVLDLDVIDLLPPVEVAS